MALRRVATVFRAFRSLRVLSDQRLERPQFAFPGFSAVNGDSDGLFIAAHQPGFDDRVRIAPVLDREYCFGCELLHLGERKVCLHFKPPFDDRGLLASDTRARLHIVSDLAAPDTEAEASGIIDGKLT